MKSKLNDAELIAESYSSMMKKTKVHAKDAVRNAEDGEHKKPDADEDGVPDWADKKQGEDDHVEDAEHDAPIEVDMSENPEPESLEVSKEIEEPEVQQEEFDDAISQLLEEEPQGNEMAFDWMNAAVEFQNTNPVFSAVAAQTAAFHRNEISQSEAISNLLERYTIAQLAPIYKHLTSN